VAACVAWLALVSAAAGAEAFLVLDGHRCLDAVDTQNGPVGVTCDPVDAYPTAVIGALFDAGHIAVDARIDLDLPMWDANRTGTAADGTYGEALRLARDAGADVLVLVLGETNRSRAGGGNDSVEYAAELGLLVIDVTTGERLGQERTSGHFNGADSPTARRDLARRISSAAAQIVLDMWRAAARPREETT
jgi:hypothetical protein